MKLLKGKVIGIAVMILGALHLSAGYSPAAKNVLTVKVSCPEILSNVPFDMTLTVTNDYDYAVRFDRVTVACLNSDLTFTGPQQYLVGGATGISVAPKSSKVVKIKVTVVTTQHPGTLVPLSVALFYKNISSDPNSFRGGAVAGAKVSS